MTRRGRFSAALVSAGEPGPAARRARWLASALLLVFLVPPAAYTLSGYAYGGGEQGSPIIVLPLVVTIAAIHLRHTRAATRTHRPPGWPMTLAALAALVYIPVLWWGLNWAAAQTFLIASALLLLPLQAAIPIAAAAELGTIVLTVARPPAALQITTSYQGIYVALFWLTWLTLGGVSLYGAAQLERIAGQLYAARAELAEAAVARERLRLARDLHDLLGQSLSAVSLKGDLALALLGSNPPAAHAEIAGLTQVARAALHGMRAVTRDEHAVGLREECDGAATLLSAAGIEVRIDITPDNLPDETQELFGWAVREGVTNILRHSDACRATITTYGTGSGHRLEITNDGPRSSRGEGSGLAGLTERARPLGGILTTRHSAGQFCLVLDVPGPPP
jgi:two-component system, NarL family, sensor histidine kinase DesK